MASAVCPTRGNTLSSISGLLACGKSNQKPQHSRTNPKPRMSWWVSPTSLAAQLGRVPCHAATLDGEEGRFPSQWSQWPSFWTFCSRLLKRNDQPWGISKQSLWFYSFRRCKVWSEYMQINQTEPTRTRMLSVSSFLVLYLNSLSFLVSSFSNEARSGV